MALMLEDKRAVIAKELHKAIHPRSTEPDHVTLNYAFMLMKKAVTKLADSVPQQEHDDAMSCAYRTSEDLRAQLASTRERCDKISAAMDEDAEARDGLEQQLADAERELAAMREVADFPMTLSEILMVMDWRKKQTAAAQEEK